MYLFNVMKGFVDTVEEEQQKHVVELVGGGSVWLPKISNLTEKRFCCEASIDADNSGFWIASPLALATKWEQTMPLTNVG